MGRLPLSACETVLSETPARLAMSAMVAIKLSLEIVK
jgi:hypothetical protein